MSIRDENNAARQRQSEARANGERISFHDARRLIEQERKADEERKRTEEALRAAKPSFLVDGLGLRGPQNPVANLTIDGADGRGRDMQVRRKSERAITQQTTEAPPAVSPTLGEGIYVNSLGAGTALTTDSEGALTDTVSIKSLVAGSNITFDTSTPGEVEINATGSGDGNIAVNMAGAGEALLLEEGDAGYEEGYDGFRTIAARTDSGYGGIQVSLATGGLAVQLSAVVTNLTADGTGIGNVFKELDATDGIRLRSLKAGTNITLTQNANDITINAVTDGGVTMPLLTFLNGTLEVREVVYIPDEE